MEGNYLKLGLELSHKYSCTSILGGHHTSQLHSIATLFHNLLVRNFTHTEDRVNSLSIEKCVACKVAGLALTHRLKDPGNRSWDLLGNISDFASEDVGVSKNNGTPKSSILIWFSIILTIHFGGVSPYFWFNTHVLLGQKCASAIMFNLISAWYPPESLLLTLDCRSNSVFAAPYSDSGHLLKPGRSKLRSSWAIWSCKTDLWI